MVKSVSLWEIFARLFGAYGPQGWWPVTIEAGAPPVYRPGVYQIATEQERWEIAFGAVLAQNTSWENVKKALGALTGADIRTPEVVLALSEARLGRLIRSSGYFRQKARRLRTLAAFLQRERLAAKDTAALRTDLLALTGIGPETADSILLYAFGRTVFVIDAYTRRLAVRLGLYSREPDYETARALFEGVLDPSLDLYSEYHALIVNLAKEHCRATPRCGGCPLSGVCPTGRAGGLRR